MDTRFYSPKYSKMGGLQYIYRMMHTLQYNVRKNVYGKEESTYIRICTVYYKIKKDEYSAVQDNVQKT
jgi:hypothetical protein